MTSPRILPGTPVARLSGGAFDPTYASVGKLWDFKADPPVLPPDDAITQALKYVGWEKVRVDTEAHTVAMSKGTRIGLGGIAKGYGVDRAMQVLIDRDIEHAIVNAGGDLKALGTDDGKPWGRNWVSSSSNPCRGSMRSSWAWTARSTCPAV